MPGREIPCHFWTSKEPLRLECGETLPSYRIAYETWGELAADRSNVFVVLHALSGSSHAFASAQNPQPGWWEGLLVEGSPIDPRRHFVICSNLLGGCYGSTGPSSIMPGQSKRYGTRFPQITTRDMIEAQRGLLRSLGVDRPVHLIGGSLGGMLALEWAVLHPGEVKNAIALVAPARSSPQAIALRSVQRDAILADPAWNGGSYDDETFPSKGLSLARKIGMITYRSAAELESRFRRDERDRRFHFLEGQFEVQSYLEHQGKKFCERFDPNTYLYFSRAMDLFDVGNGFDSFEEALGRIEAGVLLLAVDSDILVRTQEVAIVQETLAKLGKRVRLELIRSIHGHDSFLIELGQVREHIARFLGA